MSARALPAGSPVDVTVAIEEAGLVAVLRSSTGIHLPAVAETLVKAGIRVLEVTLTTPGAVGLIAELHRSLGKDALVGAGTVISVDGAEASIDAGAQFVVSPTASLDVVAVARIAGVAVIPGALTPTEIVAAQRSGASAVKLFPAGTVRPDYITDIRKLFPEISIIPTGGIRVDQVEDWLRAGAVAVGLGGDLCRTSCDTGVDPALGDRARRAVDGVAAARRGT